MNTDQALAQSVFHHDIKKHAPLNISPRRSHGIYQIHRIVELLHGQLRGYDSDCVTHEHSGRLPGIVSYDLTTFHMVRQVAHELQHSWRYPFCVNVYPRQGDRQAAES